ncbi:hypothetical protein [Spartinivicinus ruber]|uniref:hypothetical protein n=1 Tax=Spartinivicinus ruber TaxID=2683272 RepID=UPI0013D3CD78|nr:hypothetical protein [Spartinivicinus ruber]
MSANLMALMAAKGINYNAMGGGDKGIPEITSNMVAGACAGMEDIPYLLIRVKYSNDHTVINELTKLVSERFNYQSDEGKQVMKAAIYEVVSDNICKFCNGTGVTRRGKCKSCAATGHKYPTVKEIADLTGIPQTTFYRKWKKVYQEAVEVLHKDVELGIKHLSGKLFH